MKTNRAAVATLGCLLLLASSGSAFVPQQQEKPRRLCLQPLAAVGQSDDHVWSLYQTECDEAYEKQYHLKEELDDVINRKDAMTTKEWIARRKELMNHIEESKAQLKYLGAKMIALKKFEKAMGSLDDISEEWMDEIRSKERPPKVWTAEMIVALDYENKSKSGSKSSNQSAQRRKERRERQWNEMYQELCAYKEQHGHTDVSQAENEQLVGWLEFQRYQWTRRILEDDRREKLESVGVTRKLEEFD